MKYGVIKYPNGNVYKGEMDCNEPDGCGVMKYKNGNFFEGLYSYGFWKNGKKYGCHKNMCMYYKPQNNYVFGMVGVAGGCH